MICVSLFSPTLTFLVPILLWFSVNRQLYVVNCVTNTARKLYYRPLNSIGSPPREGSCDTEHDRWSCFVRSKYGIFFSECNTPFLLGGMHEQSIPRLSPTILILTLRMFSSRIFLFFFILTGVLYLLYLLHLLRVCTPFFSAAAEQPPLSSFGNPPAPVSPPCACFPPHRRLLGAHLCLPSFLARRWWRWEATTSWLANQAGTSDVWSSTRC